MLKNQMWMKYAPELLTEWQQFWEEGRAVAPYRDICEHFVRLSGEQDCESNARAVAQQMAEAPMRPDYPYEEPSDYAQIRLHAGQVQPPQTPPPELRDKIAGAWIGRVSGCLLGKPMECLKSDVIRTILEETNNYPMNRYVDSREFSQELYRKIDFSKFTSWQRCWIDRIGGIAPTDDDTNYTVLALKLIEEYGDDFTQDDVLENWLYSMPMFSACTAERVAYRNAASGMLAPATALYQNPYREWIGAQIRGDFFGYLNPGDPTTAAHMAWRDASVSHTKNGIYGEMLIAAMTAHAAVCSDPEEIILRGLEQIPRKSRLYEQINNVLHWYREGIAQEEVFARIHGRYDEYFQHDWCHTIPNAMIVAASLLYGQMDFGRSVCMAVQTGFDTDCNAATVGSIVGMIVGETGIPVRWPDAFGRRLRTAIDGFHEVTLEQLTDRTMALLKRCGKT